MMDTAGVMNVLCAAFVRLEEHHPRAELENQGSYSVYRFQDKNLRAALLQKSARLISGLNAMRVLWETGYAQEMGVIARTLDEISEDVVFLCQAKTPETTTDLHRQYLESFYQEEFNVPDSPFLSDQVRPTVRRAKIHAALTRVEGQSLNPSDAKENYRTISQAFSGFVHAASPQVMDMYGGVSPHFHLTGMLGTIRHVENHKMLWTYTYRSGLLSTMFVVGFFGDAALMAELHDLRAQVEQHCGYQLFDDPQKIVAREKAKGKET